MKTKDIIEQLKIIDPTGEGEWCVPLSHGIGGPRVDITSLHMGFDWYHGQICLITDEPVVAESAYRLQGDELDNHDRWFYLRVLPNEGAAYYTGHLQSVIGKRKPKYKVGDIIKVRKAGTNNGKANWISVKIIKGPLASHMPRPEYHAVAV